MSLSVVLASEKSIYSCLAFTNIFFFTINKQIVYLYVLYICHLTNNTESQHWQIDRRSWRWVMRINCDADNMYWKPSSNKDKLYSIY